jgi:hypothetical protein
MVNHLSDFFGCLAGEKRSVGKAQAIMAGILRSGSCQLREVARAMAGNEPANCTCMQRIVAKTNLNANLLRHQEKDAFLISDPTESPAPKRKLGPAWIGVAWVA